TRFSRDWSSDVCSSDLAARTSKDGSIAILQGRAVGGTTVVNWTSSFRTPEQTLDVWKNRYGVSGMQRNELDPWFEKMEQRLKIKIGRASRRERREVSQG